jgi:hypothetical protein
LLKYLNPNIAVVVSSGFAPALPSASDASATDADDRAVEGGATAEGLEPVLHVRIVDTVTARVIYQLTIPSGSAGAAGQSLVNAEIIENAVTVTYWNSKVRSVCLCR